MEKKLGKGLGALIPEDKSKAKEKVELIRLQDTIPNRFQPRELFQREKMEELISSVKEKGIVQPVLVRPTEEGKYELIAGERRWRAANELKMEEVPALVKTDITDDASLELSIVENIQREELNPVEEANGYKKLIEVFEYTLEKVGQMVGKDKTTISNSLRILRLPVVIQEYVKDGALSMGHAKLLLSVLNEHRQKKLARKVINEGISVRQLEEIIKLNETPGKKTEKMRDPEIVNLEEDLQHRLKTKVIIRHGKKKGKIEIQYYSLEDLQRILSAFK